MSEQATEALDEIEDRNERRIKALKLDGGTLVTETAFGDVRLLLGALRAVLDTHVLSVAADDREVCTRCTWESGAAVLAEQCVLREAISAELPAPVVREGGGN
jgi:hypothetical protein